MLVGQSTEEDRDAGVTNYFAGASGLASASAKPMGVLSGLDTIESDDLEARGITLARGDCRHHAYDHQTKHLFAVLRVWRRPRASASLQQAAAVGTPCGRCFFKNVP